MTLKETLIKELEQEGRSTKKILERIPSEKFDWQPHEKSMKLKALAIHIAGLTGRISEVVHKDYLDFADPQNKTPQISDTQELISYLDKGVKESLDALHQMDEKDLGKKWIMRRGDHVIAEAPKGAIIRRVCLDHLIHHRGQLSVYLRLLDVPIPGMYGPSADEK